MSRLTFRPNTNNWVAAGLLAVAAATLCAGTDPTVLVHFPTEAARPADGRLSVQDAAAGRAALAMAFGNDGSLHLAGRNHAWVSKIGATGTELFRTHLAGGPGDSVNALALDSKGNVHLGGTILTDGVARGFTAVLDGAGERIAQTGLPSAVNALVLGHAGEMYFAGDDFVALENGWKIAPPGPVNALAVDGDGRLYAAGRIRGAAYVARLAVEQQGPRWEWVLQLGGSGSINEARALAAGRDGSIYVAGLTNSPDFPVKAAFQDRMAGVQDAFVARVNPDGSGTLWATYLGGRGKTSTTALALDYMGSPVLAGVTDAPDLPLAGAGSGHEDGFFARFNMEGSLIGTAYLRSAETGRLFAIAVSPAGEPFVAGSSTRGVEEAMVARTGARQLGASGTASQSTSSARHSGKTFSAMAFSRIHTAGSTASTTTLGAVPSPSAYGAAVTLTARVSPSSATGIATFYDGTTVLGVGTLAGGVATLSSITLPAGTTSLMAFYGGDATFAASASVLVSQAVNAALATTMVPDGSPIATGLSPAAVVVGDFNGDSKADIAIANNGDNTVTVLLGDGIGGFTAAVGSPFSVGKQPASIAISDFNGDGKADLAIVNSTDNTVTVLLGNGSGGFSPAVHSPFAVGGHPRSITIADFNGDGKADLATANYGSANVTVLLGDGTGNFTGASGSPFTVGTNPFSIAAGDFNGDGHADLAVGNQGSNNVTVLLGNGSGGFTSPVGNPFAVGNHPNSVAVGDFNGDGKADLAAANFNDNTVTVLLGNGSGGFTAASGSPFAVGTHPYSVAVGDFNGDGKADLAVANSGSANVTVLLGNGSGGFSAESGSPFGAGGNTPTALAVGDFNGDGRADLAIVNLVSANVAVLVGTGAPAKLAITQQPATGTAGLAIGNVVVQVQDANGLLETGSTAAVTLASTPSGAAGTLMVNASGGIATFSNVVLNSVNTYTLTASSAGLTSATSANIVIGAASPAMLAVTSQPSSGFVGTAIGSVVVQVQDGFGNLISGSTAAITMASTPAGVSGTLTASAVSGVATFNNLLFGAAGSYTLTASSPGLTSATGASIKIQTTSSTSLGAAPNPSVFGASVTLTATLTPASATGKATFYDGTTVLGVATLSGGSAHLTTTALGAGARSLWAHYQGDSADAASTSALVPQTVNAVASGTLFAAPGSPVAAGTNPGAVVIGDLNGDGKADMAVANSGSNNVTVLLGNGSGGFTPSSGSPFAVGNSPASITIGDFNGDGIPDLAVANSMDNTVTLLIGNGSGGFTATLRPIHLPKVHRLVPTGGHPQSMMVGDFNGDGNADLAVADFGGGDVTVLLGNGAAGFTPATGSPFAAGTNPFSLTVADFNGDGHADIAVANQGGNNVTVLLGDGTGAFTPAAASPFAVGNHPNSVAAGDFNGDGKQDLAIANNADNTVTVLLGNGSGGFTPAAGSPFAGGLGPYSIAVTDVNGDGKLDLAVAGATNGDVTVLLGDGTGAFAVETGSPFPAGIVSVAVATGDFNGDGRVDFAVANRGSNNITVLLGSTVPTRLMITQQPTAGTAGLAVGNLVVEIQDANGLLVSGSAAAVTLASTPAGASGTLTVNASGGIATFSNVVFNAANTYTLTASAAGLTSATSGNIAIGSASGAMLVITAQPSGGTVGNALGNVVVQVQDGFGNLVSGSTAAITMASTPAGVGGTVTVNAVGGIATFSNLVFGATGNYTLTASSPGLTSTTGASINILTASAISLGAAPNPSVFGAPVTLTATVTPSSATGKVTFYDGTSLLGVATLAGGSATFTTSALGAGARSLWAHYQGNSTDTSSSSALVSQTVNALASSSLIAASGSPVTAGTGPGSVVIGDLNRDGKADIAIANTGSNNVTVLLGNGSGGFTPSSGSPFAVGNSPASIAIGDFNGDGIPDLAVANALDNTVTLLIGNGSGGFTATLRSIQLPKVHRLVPTGGHPRSIMVGDFNGDGNADLAVADFGGGDVTVLLGNGAAAFTPATGSPFAAGTNPFSLTVADFNGDGHADIAVANQGSNNVTLLLGDGTGGFTQAAGSPIAVGNHPNSVTAGDFNGDGKTDLAIANNSDNTVTVLLGNGSGGFTAAAGSPFAVGMGPYSVAVGDINGDGKLDLVVAGATNGDVTVLLGNGSGGFVAETGSPFAAGTTSVAVAIGDFNGDGRADIAVANLGSNNVTILLGVSGNGAATQLKITQQPTTGTAGVAIGNVVVQVQDAGGNLVTGSNAPVTIASTPSGVAGTLTVNAVSGVATFSNLIFNTATTYALTASSTGLASATSGNIVVSAAAAAKLAITSQPTNGIVGTPIGNVVVQVQDSFGNLIAGSTASVSISSTPTGVSGTTVVGAVAGVATFSNLVFNTPATYTVTASSTGLASAFSSSIAITLPASRLVITSPPASGTAGTALATVVVKVEDANGNVVTGSTAPVTISSTPAGVGGTLSANAVSGVATFSNLVFTKTGRYTISATSPGLTTATSPSFTVSAAVASLLKIKAQPTTGKAGTLLGKILVQVQDSFGNLVTTSTAAVTVAATGPGTFKTGGTTTVNAVAGVASFANLELDTAGSYTITASSPGLTSGTTTTIHVTAGTATKIAFTVQPVNGTHGVRLTPVNVQVQDDFGNLVRSTASITVTANGPGSFTAGSKTIVSAIGGNATFGNLTLATVGTYTMTAASPGLTSATSNSFTVQ